MGGARGIGIKKFPNNKIQLETYNSKRGEGYDSGRG